jgi:Fic-DOC domain mobile mystery protein B
MELRVLVDDANFWVESQTYLPEEIAIRFKHRLVSIHCFPNGNGRHSRIMADLIVLHVFGLNKFSWGNSSLLDSSEQRKMYLNALKLADNGDFSQLIKFARS